MTEGWLKIQEMLVAAARGCSNVISLLLSRGVEVNQQTCDGDTMLIAAAEAGQLHVVAQLLDHGADINQSCSQCLMRTPLQRAVAAEQVHCVKFLLERGAAADVRDTMGKTALAIAACKGNSECCEALLCHGAAPDIGMPEFGTPLAVAASSNHPEVMKCLIRHGCKVNICNHHGRSALHLAVFSQGALANIRTLLAAGADPDIQDKDGNTALIYAVFYSRPDIVCLLLQQNCDPDLRGSMKYLPSPCTAIDVAITFSKRHSLMLLLRAGCDVTSLEHCVRDMRQTETGSDVNTNIRVKELEKLMEQERGLSLARACRSVIRRSLGCSGEKFIKALSTLSLPGPLAEFIALTDLQSL